MPGCQPGAQLRSLQLGRPQGGDNQERRLLRGRMLECIFITALNSTDLIRRVESVL